MRLDKFLKVSRIIKRRTVANEICDQGQALVNGRVAKAGLDIKPGDKIEISLGERVVRLEVLEVKESIAAKDAASLYRLLDQ